LIKIQMILMGSLYLKN